jgi:hypothetical protein
MDSLSFLEAAGPALANQTVTELRALEYRVEGATPARGRGISPRFLRQQLGTSILVRRERN